MDCLVYTNSLKKITLDNVTHSVKNNTQKIIWMKNLFIFKSAILYGKPTEFSIILISKSFPSALKFKTLVYKACICLLKPIYRLDTVYEVSTCNRTTMETV